MRAEAGMMEPPAKNAQGHHLEHHLHGKEDKDEVIEDLQGQEEDKKQGTA